MAARPQVPVQKIDADGVNGQVVLPAVFLAPIRTDIVHFVHSNMAKNRRQPYAVSAAAGHQHSAESWGTGRAVARVPRVSGGGTSRAGQGAFANSCRKGRMFAPTKTWRKWHRKINTNQKRFAVASALAASASAPLVAARGHKIDNLPHVPLVVDNSVESLTKTRQALAALKVIGADADVDKAKASRKLRRGKGKLRNRRHVQRRGPLIVFNEDNGLVRAFRNLSGVELAHVDSLNLLQLAPGGHLGRFIIWTKSAFNKLHDNWGSTTRESKQKKGYYLPRAVMSNADLARIINSDEIQSKLRPAAKQVFMPKQKKNPLTNFGTMVKLNPYALSLRRSELLSQERRSKVKAEVAAASKKAAKAASKKHSAVQKENFARLVDDSKYALAAKTKIEDELILGPAVINTKKHKERIVVEVEEVVEEKKDDKKAAPKKDDKKAAAPAAAPAKDAKKK